MRAIVAGFRGEARVVVCNDARVRTAAVPLMGAAMTVGYGHVSGQW